ncbi:MAG: FecR domain-containing protein [Deltaproteobacteria bacterium]|nr:FecR domain-containing protein [Deltaproteobacteria bacterium]
MRATGWLCVAVAVLASGCRPRREAPAADSAAPAPSGPDATAVVAPPVAPVAVPDVAEPVVPAAPEEPVPAGTEPWLGFADGTVRCADADGERGLVEGRTVLPGTIVWTESFSHAELDLPDGSLADLDELTELLVQKVRVAGSLRRVELVLLGGAARFVVAPSLEAGSAFQVSTPVGILETAAGELSVEVDLDSGATRLVVRAGSVVAHHGTATRTVTGEGSAVGALELPAGGEPRDAVPWPELIDRWVIWDEWQGDRLLDLYDLDPAAPWTTDVPALSLERHPQWAATLHVRRNRVEARARELAGALGPEGLAAEPEFRVRRARARDVLGPLVDIPRQQSALQAQRPARLERWRALERTRADRRAAMRPQLARLRDGEPPSPAPE